MRVWVCAMILVLVGVPVFANDKFTLGPPPKILGCTIAATGPLNNPFGPFGSCVSTAITNHAADAADIAAATAEAAAQGTIDTLNDQKDQLQQDIAGLNSQIAQLSTPVSQALSALPTQGLHNCLSARGINLGQIAQQAASSPHTFAAQRMTDIWQTAMQKLQDGDLGPRNFSISSKGQTPSASAIAARAEQMMGEVATSDPVGQCMWELSGPFRAQARSVAIQIYPTVKAQYDQAVNNVVLPQAMDMFNQQLSSMLNQVGGISSASSKSFRTSTKAVARGTGNAVSGLAKSAAAVVPEHMQDTIYAVAQDYIMNPAKMRELKAEIELLAGMVSSNNAKAATQQRKVEGLLREAMIFNDRMAMEVAIETLRREGHALIDAQGPDVINIAISVIQAVKDVVVEVVTGIVAIFYEPAEVIGEIVAGVVELIIDASTPVTEKMLITSGHDAFEQAISHARRALREGKPPSYYINQAGPLKELLQTFPTENELVLYASPKLAQMKTNLFAYHNAVLNLSRAATTKSRATSSSRIPTSRTPTKSKSTR